MRATPSAEFVFNPEALAGLPVVYYGGVRMQPNAVGALQRAVFAKFPTITVVNIADALAIAQQVVDQIALVIRFLSGFAILAGAIILAASVAGTRFRRVREVVILKTLGATSRQDPAGLLHRIPHPGRSGRLAGRVARHRHSPIWSLSVF